MRRRNKILLIIIISSIITYLIFFNYKSKKINIVSIGDGIASGETSYNLEGISYNDYLKEYFNSKKLLNNYNNSLTSKNYNLLHLNNDIDNNININSHLKIQQLIHNANIITISIGEEELTKLSLTNDLNDNTIKDFIKNYDYLINKIKELSDAKIFIISFYINNYLSNSNVIILNANLLNIAHKYNASLININDLLINKDYFFNKKDYYFNYKAHQEIADMIINSL